jgi:hypothetical protein
MNRNQFLCVALGTLLACNSKETAHKAALAEPFSADVFKASAKEDFELIECFINKDTLELVSASSALYYPFGQYSTIQAFADQNQAEQFATVEEYTYQNASLEKETLYRLTYSKGYLKVFLNEETDKVEIIAARIEAKPHLINGIQTGQAAKELLKQFFTHLPDQGLEQLKVIKLTSGVTGIWHYYLLEEGRIKTIIIDSDYQFEKQ